MRTLTIVVLALVPVAGVAQDKKDKKNEPAVKVVLPLGAAPGKTTTLTVRGFVLDQAKDVTIVGVDAKIKIVSKGAAPVPDKNQEKVGDTQVVIELTLPDKTTGELMLSVVTPLGVTKPHPLIVETKLPVAAEKEPNPGFRQSQEVKLPGVIEGAIQNPKDVDVFRFAGKAGQKVTIEIHAARYGSALDGVLTLYHERSERPAQLAFNDDKKGLDPVIEATLPADGVYYIVLQDAHDTGSAIHVYRLLVR